MAALASVLAPTGAASTALAAPAAHSIMQLSEPDALWLPTQPTSPVLATTAGPTATVKLAALTSPSYRFSSILDGQPVRWNPCQAIHWKANVARGPVGGLDVLKAAVAHVAYKTGTQWVFDGTTATVPNTAYLPKTPTNTNKPVVIGWTDGTASDLLRYKPAAVLGMTRTVWFGVDDGMGHRVAATRAAVVALDRTDRLPLRGVQSWSATALHELGHVMGLDHPADTHQLMASTLPNVSTLQTGDNTGLGRVGKAAGCVVIPGA
ncbi:MAG: matrixin family metalloprotease [Frankiaceae bacterium]|nr:matrixin family metalloprotease [Frankiaceae bacterium]